MKVSMFFLTLFYSFCFSVSAQTDDFQETVITYLNSNGTQQQYNMAYDEMFGILKEQFLNVPEKEWSALKVGKKGRVQEVIGMLAGVYGQHFSELDIEQMTSFYKTETARKLVSGSSDLSDEDKNKINSFFESQIGKKIASKAEVLSAGIEEVSSNWSRDLFFEKRDALLSKGYAIKD